MGLTKANIVDFYRDEADRCRIGIILILIGLFTFRKTISKSIKFLINKYFGSLFHPIAFGKKGKILDVEVA